jgi:dihydroorotase (multifunctional complex type)
VYDLGIEGGTLVSPRGRRRANLYITGDTVSEVTNESRPCQSAVDATSLFVMPGMVDAHVHFMDPGAPEREDFPTASGAAAIAGVTTVIEHTHAAPVTTAQQLREKARYLDGRSYIDYGLAAHVMPDRIEEAGSVWNAGATYLKAFTCTTHGIAGCSAGRLLDLFSTAAELSATCLIHCEDESITADAERALRESGRVDNAVIPEWRCREAELVALNTVMLLAGRTGAHVVAAHVSSREGLDIVTHHRAQGANVAAESCPQYFLLEEHEVLKHGGFRKFTPPARSRGEGDFREMWEALRQGKVTYLATDHAPATREQKLDGSIWDVHFGLPGIDTTLPILLNAAHAELLPYERIVEAYAMSPARTYGLPRCKGRLEVGDDADLVLVDPTVTWTLDDTVVRSRAGWTPYAGTTIRGRVIQTYARGTLIASDGELVTDERRGRFIAGRGVTRLD